MRFIRAFWGDINCCDGRAIKEITHVAKTSKLNDLVYVWGDDNYNFVTLLGLEAIKVSSNSTVYGSDYLDDCRTFFNHKLKAIKLGVIEFGEVVFLDWDCHQIKEIDEDFYTLLRYQNNKVQFPMYSFPEDYVERVLTEWPDIGDKDRKYLIKQFEYIKKHNYKLNSDYIVPNFSFVYCTDTSLMDELMELSQNEYVDLMTEESAAMYYIKQIRPTLDDFVQKNEPLVCDAKNEHHFNQKDYNTFVKKYLNKQLYFVHE